MDSEMPDVIDRRDWEEVLCDKCNHITMFDRSWKDEDKKCMVCNPTKSFKEWQKWNQLI